MLGRWESSAYQLYMTVFSLLIPNDSSSQDLTHVTINHNSILAPFHSSFVTVLAPERESVSAFHN